MGIRVELKNEKRLETGMTSVPACHRMPGGDDPAYKGKYPSEKRDEGWIFANIPCFWEKV